MTITGADVDVAALQGALARDVRGEVAFDEYTRTMFASDASMYAIQPLGVVVPRDVEDIQATIAIAREHHVPLTARGAGTSLAGQTTSTGLVLDTSRYLNVIHDLDHERRSAVVDVGVVQDQLNLSASPHGLMFGPDTSTSNRATIGGMIGNNSAGSGSLRFGMTIDHVRALDVVLSDATRARFEPVDAARVQRLQAGEGLEAEIYRGLLGIAERHATVIETDFPPHWRRAGGYRLDRIPTDGGLNLAQFVVGSEGTLAVVTRAEVGLVQKPRVTMFLVGHFATVNDALEATEDALACEPAQVEMMDKTILDLSRSKLEYAELGRYLVGDPGALLFVSFSGDDSSVLRSRADELVERWRDHGHGYHVLRADAPEQQAALLKVRKASLGLLMAASSGTRRPLAFVEDTAVSPSRLAEYTRRFAEVLDQHGLEAGFYGHASVGCLHIRPFVDVSEPDQVDRMRAVAVAVKDLVKEYGGVNSSEHGDGLARSEFNRDIFGPELYGAMQNVKTLFDPVGILNPGKIVDAPAMTAHLRDERPSPRREPRTHLDFTVVGGMRGAADRCMNIGLCRKSTSGVMCPSYIATRQEEHSTRGRANALVQALNSPEPELALAGDDRLHEILDLCLMCKACKSECPLSVDMSALKTEVLAHKNERDGIPLRSRAFASIRSLNRMGAATAPISNRIVSSRPIRTALQRWVGITSARALPRFERETLPRWFAHRQTTPGRHGTVTFLADSFTSFTEPGIGRAAVELLELCGWGVRLEAGGCCGRSALSKGLVDGARARADDLLDRLRPEEPGPIVGCEPSCLFTLTDDYASLLPDDPRVAGISGRVTQVEELVLRAIEDGYLQLQESSWLAGRNLLYHGHCHQKAAVGTAVTMAMLRRIPGVAVEEIDGGCCGMAGSFGFEVEHYELSLRVGNDRLFPTIADSADDAVIIASGVSCRQQIAHGTERSALHPLEVLHSVAVNNQSRGAYPSQLRPHTSEDHDRNDR